MKIVRFAAPIAFAAGAVAFAACNDATSVDSIYDDSAVTLDVAASAGDAAATMVDNMTANESNAGASADLSGSAAISAAAAPTSNASVVRTKTCFDAAGAVVANCTPLSSVRKIATHVTIDGSRSSTTTSTGGTSATWTGVVHRVSNDTATRVFTASTETSRIHADIGTAHDTTTFTDATGSRLTAEVAHDSVKNVTFNLPRSSNPYPVSGSIVRVDSVHVAVTKANKSVSRDVVRTVEVDFPADAQGNVVLKVNAKTCNLNLVTHVVSACK